MKSSFTVERLWDIINTLLDELDMSYGYEWTVCKLYDCGFTPEEIRAMGYDCSDEEIEKIVSEEGEREK